MFAHLGAFCNTVREHHLNRVYVFDTGLFHFFSVFLYPFLRERLIEMRVKNFMHRLSDSEWIGADAYQYALNGEVQMEDLVPEKIQNSPEIIYVKDQQNYLVGSVEKELLLFLIRSENTAVPLQILDAIHDGIIAVDAEGRIYYANEAYTTVLGVPLRRILGKYIQKIEPGALLVKALQERTFQESQKQMVSSVGKYVSLRAFPLWNGETFMGAVSIFQDVTEIHHLNREVRHMARIVDEYSQRLQEYEVSIDLHLTFQDRSFQKVIQQAATVARADISVLLQGEPGTGKGIVAQYLHRCSSRREKPFITVNCSTVSEELLSEELFGEDSKSGKLGLAQGGTLFLDEIGDMPPRTQSKLQGALSRQSDVRLIVSSSQPLQTLVQEKKFRQDLYFQIAAITLDIPPLRERPDDIIPMANYFLEHYNKKHQKDRILAPSVYKNLCAYHWPGNIRELESYIERLVILGRDTQPLPVVHAIEKQTDGQGTAYTGTLDEQVLAFETQAIRTAIQRCGGNRSQAIKELGISRRTFYRKCAELGISDKK